MFNLRVVGCLSLFLIGGASGTGICYGVDNNNLEFCQAVGSKASCPNKFIEPPLSQAALNTYCGDKGFCCADASGKRYRLPRGQTCEGIGKVSAPCQNPVSWCRALKSASISSSISGEIAGDETSCRQACINNPQCEGFDFAENPKRCVLVKALVPFLDEGALSGLDPIDDIWTTFVSSYNPACPSNNYLWYNLEDSLADFTDNSGLVGFSVTPGTSTILPQRNTPTPREDVIRFASELVDNFYYVDAETKVVKKLTGTATQLGQYKATLANTLNLKLKTSPGVATQLSWNTPFGPRSTVSIVIGGECFETLAGTFLASDLDATNSKFRTASHLPPLLVIGGVTQNVIAKIFTNSAGQSVATFLGSVDCTVNNECLGGTVARIRMPLCQARSEYSVECNMDDPQIRGCQMILTFLTTCGRPTISYDSDTYEYTVTGLGFTAWQQSYRLGKPCQCGQTPK